MVSPEPLEMTWVGGPRWPTVMIERPRDFFVEHDHEKKMGYSWPQLPDDVLTWLEANVGSIRDKNRLYGEGWSCTRFQGQERGKRIRQWIDFRDARHALLFKLSVECVR